MGHTVGKQTSMATSIREIAPTIFVSRAGEDKEVAALIDQILRDAGYNTFIQDKDFGHTSFMERMAEGFRLIERGGRLVALLSNNYQRKAHCLKEARFPLIDDPMNRQQRLIVLRIDDCSPCDFLKDIPYVDLGLYLDNHVELATAVIGALSHSISVDGRHSKMAVDLSMARDPKIENLLLYLENEDETNPEQGVLYVMAGVGVVACCLIAFDYFIDLWNWLFGTSHVVLFSTPEVISFALIFLGLTVLALFWHVRGLSRVIEDARLTASQMRSLREDTKAREWKSKSLIEAALSIATRKLTSRR